MARRKFLVTYTTTERARIETFIKRCLISHQAIVNRESFYQNVAPESKVGIVAERVADDLLQEFRIIRRK
ncbi:hypothetical protein [Tolypothrix sp. VBCCA 56010]|uniref:hypothetical protein n=1 Tax=Tolypothrix sp. VBCCA 56010 TaxID=3137731 RepID=UPI003D7E7989